MNGRTLEVTRTTSTAHRLIHYDGICSDTHGHNFTWDVRVSINMEDSDESNMPVDLKDISNTIDRVDHRILLNEEDELAAIDTVDPIVFDSDPTCERVSKWMAQQVFEVSEAIIHVNLTLYETDKYGVSASYGMGETNV